MKNNLCIIGAGGFGREVLCCLKDYLSWQRRSYNTKIFFMVDDKYYNQSELMGHSVLKWSSFQPEKYSIVVAIGDPVKRKEMVDRLPAGTDFLSITHPSAVVSDFYCLGEGSILTAGVIVTCNVEIGKHAHLNLHSTIGHDCEIGDYFTAAPGVHVSGNVKIGDCVNIGTNAAIREGVSICSDVVIGMGAVVVKNITQPGTYVGNPAKLLQKR